MTERKRRKKNKVRGERTHGMGDTKNNRGAGSRGGRGRAGANKGKFASIGRLDLKKCRLKPRTKGKCISLGDLNNQLGKLVKAKKIKMEKDFYIIDKQSGYEKILSQGIIDKKLIVKISTSKKAVQKIIDAKGRIENGKETEFEE